MKFLFDQNIFYHILKQLPKKFEDAAHVKTENLIDASDQQIWDYAREKDFTIVTQDLDFNDLNSLYGFPPKIIWIRTGNISTSEIDALLLDFYTDIIRFVNNSEFGCFEIVRFKK
ncbi:MAG: DUF5615 family PIN-like protein [Cyclobacteriaceae bacterium]